MGGGAFSAARLVVVANPSARRTRLFEEAARPWAAEHGIDLVAVPWLDVIRAGGRLDRLAAFDGPASLRLDSPGGDDAVSRAFLAAAAARDPTPSAVLAVDAPYLNTEIRPQAQLHAGIRVVLDGLAASLRARPDLAAWSPPSAVALMLDKHACREWLEGQGIPCPPGFAPRDRAELESGLEARRWRNWFLKLRWGSCASGIARFSDGRRRRTGVTTLTWREGRPCDGGRLRRLTDPLEVEATLATLVEMGAVVEPAVDLARVDGDRFDARVVVIRGGAPATIFRRSPHAITNLYLGGRRADPARCVAAVGRARYLDGLEVAHRAAFAAGARVVGVDVLFDRAGVGAQVLELNPFGDFFPGWTDDAGRNIPLKVLEAWRLTS